MLIDQATAQTALKFYNDNYQAIVWHDLIGTTKIHLGKRSPQNCRYCRRVAPTVKFKKTAHAFPELLGNRILISCDECDSCNDLFARTLEDSFGKYTLLHRTASRVRGKTGVPSYKSNDGKSRWDTKNGEGHIQAQLGDDSFQIDEETCEMRVKVIRPPYYPRLAYKCLVKMALSVMPDEELRHFQRTLDWLLIEKPANDPYKIHCPVMMSFVSGPTPFSTITFGLLRKRDAAAQLPHYMFFVSWANYQFQIHLPFSNADLGLKGDITVPFIPNPYSVSASGRKVDLRTTDWSSRERISGEMPSLTFKFDSFVKGSEPKQA